MKKFNLFKVLMISILFTLFLSWVIPYGNSSSPKEIVGIWDLLLYPSDKMLSFGAYFIYFLAIGLFYGILNKTGVYSKLIKKIVGKFKCKENTFLIGIMITLSLLVSLTGLTIEWFVIFPFIISIVLLFGYDKLVALSVTLGSIMVGTIGGIFGFGINGIINNILKLETTNAIGLKIFIFLIVLIFWMYEVIKYASNNLKNPHNSIVYEKKVDDLLLYNKKESKKSLLPLVIILGITVVFIIVGVIPWTNLNSKWTLFSDFHSNLMNVKFLNIFINGIQELGTWDITEISVLLLIMSLILSFIYGIKINDFLESAIIGAKKNISTGMLVFLSVVVVFIALYNPFLQFLNDLIIGLFSKFNFILGVILTLIDSLFYNNIMYLSQVLIPSISSNLSISGNETLIALIIQVFNGLTVAFVPTSLMLVASLAYTKVSYFDWFKHIFKIILKLFIGLFIIIGIISLFI